MIHNHWIINSFENHETKNSKVETNTHIYFHYYLLFSIYSLKRDEKNYWIVITRATRISYTIPIVVYLIAFVMGISLFSPSLINTIIFVHKYTRNTPRLWKGKSHSGIGWVDRVRKRSFVRARVREKPLKPFIWIW